MASATIQASMALAYQQAQERQISIQNVRHHLQEERQQPEGISWDNDFHQQNMVTLRHDSEDQQELNQTEDCITENER